MRTTRLAGDMTDRWGTAVRIWPLRRRGLALAPDPSALSEALARIERLEKRADRQAQLQRGSDARLRTVFEEMGSVCERAGESVPDREITQPQPRVIPLRRGRRDSA